MVSLSSSGRILSPPRESFIDLNSSNHSKFKYITKKINNDSDVVDFLISKHNFLNPLAGVNIICLSFSYDVLR